MVWVPQMKRTLARPKPQRSEAVPGGADQAGIVGQAEVVVGAEIQHLAPGDGDARALRALDDALVLPESRRRISSSSAWSRSLTAPYMWLLLPRSPDRGAPAQRAA